MRQASTARSLRARSTTSHVLMASSLALAISVAMPSAVAQSAPAGQVQQLRYDIPAGPLDQSLNLFAARSRTLLVVDPEITRGKQGPALNGNFSSERALELLLSGSGLQAERRADGGIVIQKRAVADGANALPTVSVVASSEADSGLKRAASSGALGERSVLDTPFSISVIDKSDIQDRQVTTVEQAFRYDASVTSASGEYGRGSSLMVRGLGLDDANGFKIDGLALPGWGNDLLPMEVFERVELLKGLSGFMYGFGSPGGIMNYVLKRPTDETTFSADVGYKTDSLFYKHIDMGGRAGEDNRFGYRLNVSQEQGGTYFTGGSIDRSAISLATDMKLTNDLKWTFDTLYARRRSTGNAFWGMYVGTPDLPGTIDPTVRLQPQGAYYNNENTVVTTGLEWKLNPDWKASFSWRYARENIDTMFGDLSIDNAAGDTSTSLTAYIYAFQYQQAQAMLEGKFKTGSIGHQMVMGASHQVYEVLSDRGGMYYNPLGNGNIHVDSSLTTGTTTTALDSMYMSARTTQDTIFASDTVSFNDQWSLIGGLRYIRFDQGNYNNSGIKTANYKRNPVTPTVALMFKPVPALTTYLSYVEALEQGGTADATKANAGATLPPLKSKQVETGIKFEQERWSATAALFRMQRGNEYTNSANYYVQDGEIRHQGIDLSGNYDVTRELTLAGGLMLLDAKYQNGTAELTGKRVTGSPHMQATLALRYRVPGVEGLIVNAGGRYVGQSKLNTNDNQLDLSAYTVFDTGAIYRTRLGSKDVTFNAQIQNLANRRYWVYNGNNYVFAAAPRTLSLNARVDF
jgi:iron complex outermembrane receptor protein